MEKEFEKWYEENERRFRCGLFDEKQITYSAWIEARNQALSMSGVSDMCHTHKPNLKDSYVQWQAWAEIQSKKGIKQTQCEKCKRWLFPSEF